MTSIIIDQQIGTVQLERYSTLYSVTLVACGSIADFVIMVGLGPVQKRIRRAFWAHPDRVFRTVDLVGWCYPRSPWPDLNKRRAIYRAAEAVARRLGRDWRGVKWGAKERTGGLP